MKGTRLWQQPGSPIIQGRSRTMRAFWESWLSGAAMSAVLAAAVTWGALAWRGRDSGAALRAGLRGLLSASGGLGVAGCVIGAAVGAGIARSMGWRREWLAGALAGAGLAAVLVLWF